MSSLLDGMIMNTENPKTLQKKLLERIDGFINVTGNKINIQKPVAFLDTINTELVSDI